jgi:ankyrin repeat protein
MVFHTLLLLCGNAAGATMEFIAPGHRFATPLHAAASSGNSTVVQQLLFTGADVQATDVGAATPLHCAAAAGHPEVMQQLLAAGADVEASTSKGLTPYARGSSCRPL